MTVAESYRQGLQALTAAGVEDAAFDCGCLFAFFCGYSHALRLAHANDCLSSEKTDAFLAAVRRRASGEPLQYILGSWSFYGRTFLVGPGVLIPRPETELLVHEALRAVANKAHPVIWDLCAGTGCIGLTLALERPDAQVFLLEKFSDAFSYLEKNRCALGAGNAALLQADVLSEPPELPRPDLIVSNPPYVPTPELPLLQAEVQAEPATALDGGADGLCFFRAIRRFWLPRLCGGGVLLLECGDGQGKAVADLLRTPKARARVLYDGNRIDRFVEITV